MYQDDENHPTACAFHGHVTFVLRTNYGSCAICNLLYFMFSL